MRLNFTVYGSPIPERRRSFYVGPAGAKRMVNVRVPEVTKWISEVKAQAVHQAPDVLPSGGVRVSAEFVLPRPDYLMAPKFWWRCRSRKCGWKGTEPEAVWAVGCMVGACCPDCKGEALPPERTPDHVVKPDVENLEKLVWDAFTGLFWRDDSQRTHTVADAPHGKRYAEIGEQPHVSFVLELKGGERACLTPSG